jgi:HSP20 family molecular chaperone IbpA
MNKHHRFDLIVDAIGFEWFANNIDQQYQNPNFPPTDIFSDGERTFVQLALAGWKSENLKVELWKGKEPNLTVTGMRSKDDPIKDRVYNTPAHSGITKKDFIWKKPISPHAVIEEVKFEDGLLTIKIGVDMPKELKPITFKIS